MSLIIGIFTSCKSADKVVLIKSESYYSDFKVKEDKVYIICHLTLENRFNKQKTIRLSAEFPNDVGVLLKDAVVDSKSSIVLDATSKKSFDVIFVGNFAGRNQKHDRLLPDIDIILK